MPFKVKKKKAAIKPPAGNVTNQEIMMFNTTRKSKAPTPRAKPTPKIEPINMCVVETGIPVREASTTVVAAASSAQKPLDGVSSVIFLPTVSITL